LKKDNENSQIAYGLIKWPERIAREYLDCDGIPTMDGLCNIGKLSMLLTLN
jgi:hypothetical protein